MQNKCKDCKWLDTSARTSVGCLCRNQSRIRKKTAKSSVFREMHISDLKPPSTIACKSGFEPKKREVAT